MCVFVLFLLFDIFCFGEFAIPNEKLSFWLKKGEKTVDENFNFQLAKKVEHNEEKMKTK